MSVSTPGVREDQRIIQNKSLALLGKVREDFKQQREEVIPIQKTIGTLEVAGR
jgi:hypothetical protein